MYTACAYSQSVIIVTNKLSNDRPEITKLFFLALLLPNSNSLHEHCANFHPLFDIVSSNAKVTLTFRWKKLILIQQKKIKTNKDKIIQIPIFRWITDAITVRRCRTTKLTRKLSMNCSRKLANVAVVDRHVCALSATSINICKLMVISNQSQCIPFVRCGQAFSGAQSIEKPWLIN